MGRESEERVKMAAGGNLFAVLLVLFSLYPVVLYAQASVVVQPPTSLQVNSPFGMRRHPVHGTMRPHRGVDYPTPQGTTLNTPGPVTCHFQGSGTTGTGWGRYARVSLSCGNGNVTLLYAHLSECTNGATSIRTGGARGTSGAGTSTGAHLHFEVHLPDGTRVNPVEAYGQNLCDPEVQRRLAQSAQNALNGQAGGGGGTTAPANPTQPTPGGGGGVGGTPGGGYTPPPGGGNGGYNPPPGSPSINPAVIPPTTGDVVPSGGEGGDVTGCATDTWTAMVNQSVLQTRREMLMNQRYIAKADSVLVYSCFEDAYRSAGQTLGIFNESQRWANRQIDIMGRTVTINVNMGQYSLDGAITNAVDTAVEVYLGSNFGHEFLGGLLSGPLVAESASSESQYGAPCGTMNQVWQMAKCHNVTDEPLFYRFEDLIDNDPRIYPHTYACEDSGITQAMIDIARHGEVLFDDIEPRLEMLTPENGACHPPIPTGLTVSRQVGEGRITEEVTYDDALCITAGCSYQNPGFSGLGTCEIATP